jgi:hypothetical protein
VKNLKREQKKKIAFPLNELYTTFIAYTSETTTSHHESTTQQSPQQDSFAY